MFGLDFIRKLKPCKWRYKGSLDDGVEHFGFIAQEVHSIAPKEQYGFTSTDEYGMYSIHLHQFISPIIKAIQEIDERLTTLEQGEIYENTNAKIGDMGHD